VASTTFRVEFFANSAADPSGFGQGRTFLGYANAMTDATGYASVTASGLVLPAGQDFVSATATNLTTNDTSQFANDLAIPIASAGGPYIISEGNSLPLNGGGSYDPARGPLTYSWDVNGDGVFGDATGVTPTLTWSQLEALAINDGPATFQVSVKVTNAQGNSTISPATTLTVNDTPVSNLHLALQSSSINEGSSASLSGSFVNPSPVDTHTVTIDWGDGSNPTVLYLEGVLSFTGVTHLYSDEPDGVPSSSYPISVTVTDGENLPISAGTSIQVNAMVPTASVSGPTLAVPGQPCTFTFLGTSPSPSDQVKNSFTYAINWDDGSPVQTITAKPGKFPVVVVDHLYTTPRVYIVSMRATDEDGTGPAASQGIVVYPVQMQGNSLVVGGTTGNDTITLMPADATGDISVNVNGMTSFNGQTKFKPTDHILVYGQSGNDTILLQSNKIAGTPYPLTVPAIVYGGGTGMETLNVAGSNTTNVVVGGGGSNTITGGSGRDILIAGLGKSKIFAGSGGDILIGGWTTYSDLTDDLTGTDTPYSQKLLALEAIMAEWGSSADNYPARINYLSYGGGLNGSNLLNASTVHDNGQADTLSGISSMVPLDWFFVGASDVQNVKKQNSGEPLTPIS
jgi:hypothetical protein